ncbi:MAG: hypothetical protein ACJ8F2_09370, partial [Xanthobacteraceae bacterium]
ALQQAGAQPYANHVNFARGAEDTVSGSRMRPPPLAVTDRHPSQVDRRGKNHSALESAGRARTFAAKVFGRVLREQHAAQRSTSRPTSTGSPYWQ